VLNRNIFREFDIRGQVGQELDEDMARRIVLAFAAFVHERGRTVVLVGRDNRHSSLWFRDLTVEALRESGLDVVDLGELITPMFYFASYHLGIDAGLMITASHNPGDHNGYKLLFNHTTIFGQDIQDIARRASERQRLHAQRRGSLSFAWISEEYIREITSRIKLGDRPLKAVVDCGSGTTSHIGPRVLRELGVEVVELFCISDPDFPHHHPDPVRVENLQDLIRGVHREEADLGIGFDADGDRIGVVDEKGDIVWGDILMVLFWREILAKHPGLDCLVEVKSSQALIDEIKRLGGNPIIYKTGHSAIKAKMQEIGALFAGETSGHMFLADEYYGFDDAIYASCRLLRILSNTDQTLSQMLSDVPKYHAMPELRLPSTETEKLAVVQQVLDHFRQRYEVITVDGARILFPGGWGLVRASANAAEIVVRAEGATPEDLGEIITELFGYLKSLGFKTASSIVNHY